MTPEDWADLRGLFRGVLALQLAYAFLHCVYCDFNGRPAEPPDGFGGFVGTLIGMAVVVGVIWGAGGFGRTK